MKNDKSKTKKRQITSGRWAAVPSQGGNSFIVVRRGQLLLVERRDIAPLMVLLGKMDKTIRRLSPGEGGR
jgi:hypothetical protein